MWVFEMLYINDCITSPGRIIAYLLFLANVTLIYSLSVYEVIFTLQSMGIDNKPSCQQTYIESYQARVENTVKKRNKR